MRGLEEEERCGIWRRTLPAPLLSPRLVRLLSSLSLVSSPAPPAPSLCLPQPSLSSRAPSAPDLEEEERCGIWRKRRDVGSGGGRGDPGVPAVARPMQVLDDDALLIPAGSDLVIKRVPIKFVDGRGDASAPCQDKAEEQHGCGRSDRGDGIASFLPPFHNFDDPDKAVCPGLEADGKIQTCFYHWWLRISGFACPSMTSLPSKADSSFQDRAARRIKLYRIR
ncbi:uncharacterized protein [Triticum aestivum]|uniref:uncharacterized protein isoform X2 n=1 Tax=Triticum aestivum TaxID=4565 RepID=UPI001D01310F|nr:uncharacterized protein LOC123121833 isoform X2 [Triticum aestivum]